MQGKEDLSEAGKDNWRRRNIWGQGWPTLETPGDTGLYLVPEIGHLHQDRAANIALSGDHFNYPLYVLGGCPWPQQGPERTSI